MRNVQHFLKFYSDHLVSTENAVRYNIFGDDRLNFFITSSINVCENIILQLN
jgi:hypothetical protein